jgi:hypothetical protein
LPQAGRIKPSFSATYFAELVPILAVPTVRPVWAAIGNRFQTHGQSTNIYSFWKIGSDFY